ncbi:predicted protein [Sclerotinia sclerotiorum 1980 UF-70]|uniref:Uncharacterized protein n=1 Tax=Sclerotinia sclerotiorum (strain ATCC 18683 / 1980 / Ss-1) TaxID=665079 RepID=A7F615_SCLS1|nr:predicted protein [Sclerotinia sclerotiorum 1980 UF-70]EDN98186.1 predicted protein [Sclerotinia sclerotiorum 1980 UF-70]
MSFPYQKVTQTNRLARTPASSAAAQPSGSANQEIQYTPGLRQVVDVLPVSVAHRDGVDPAVTKAAKDRAGAKAEAEAEAKAKATGAIFFRGRDMIAELVHQQTLQRVGVRL